MEILVILIAAGVILYFGYKKLDKTKEDGSHPLDGATKAPYKIETPPIQPTISNILDVNKDGKVDVEDVKEVVKKAKTKAKKVATEVTEKVKKPKKKKAE